MGVIAGICWFDGRPVAFERDALVRSLPPLGSASGLAFTWDGRLDNRDDLLLRLYGRLAEDSSDRAIALAAFERWGVDGLRALVGDWCIAAWDGRRRRLHLACDYMGVRPLYYLAGNGFVTWSSSLAELAVRADRTGALDETFVARFMALRFSDDVTPYEHIRSVPAATCLTFSSGADPSSSIPTQTRQTFWRLASGIVRYRDRRDYEAELRCLWADAVRVRLRSPGTVWAELSGGLDSSSVVCMADALIKAGRTEAEAIQPLSHVTLQSPEGDERRFIADVEAQIGRRSEIVGVELHDELTDPDLEWVTPFASWGVSLAGVQRIRARGGRLVLSGRVGDAVMGAQFDNSAAVYDDFGAGHLVIGLRNLRLWSRACRKPLIEIARNLLVGWLPWGRGDRIDPPQSGYDLLSPALRDRLDEDPSIANVLDDVRRSKRDMAALLLAYASGSRLTIPLHPPGVTFTYPFTHRPLVDFMMAIPGELLSSPGETRALMRRAFEGLVPPRILRRRSKGFYPPSALRAARGRAAAMRPVERLEVVRRGWIDPRRLDEAIRHLTDGGSQRGAGVRLVLRLEQWLAALRRGPAAIPDGKEVTTDAVHHA